MQLSEKQISHPRFWAMQRVINAALEDAAKQLDIRPEDIRNARADKQLARAIDTATAAFIRAYDQNHD